MKTAWLLIFTKPLSAAMQLYISRIGLSYQQAWRTYKTTGISMLQAKYVEQH